MVTLLWSNYFINVFSKPLGLSLGVNRTWTKRSDHAPKSGCADFFLICSKRLVLRNFFMFDISPSSSFVPCSYGNIWGKYKNENII